MSRRSNGEGSVTQRPDGRWEARLQVDGRRRSRYAATRKRAVAALEQLRRDAGLAVGAFQQLGEFLDAWLEVAAARVSGSTLRGYEAEVRLRLKPALGQVKLAELTPSRVNRALVAMGETGASPQMVSYAHGVLRNALGQALRWGMVASNAAAVVEPPRFDSDPPKPYTPDEAVAFLTAARADRLYALYGVAVAEGLRQGEALALGWDDVDLDAGRVHVGHTIRRVKGVWVRSKPKTRESDAWLSLPAPCVDALRAHRERQDLERSWAGPIWRPAAVVDDKGRPYSVELVFCGADGQPLHSSTVLKQFRRLCVAAGVEPRRFHDLRHSCGSLLIGLGVPQRIVMAQLRHTTLAMSAHYTQVVDPALEEAAQRLGDLLFPSG